MSNSVIQQNSQSVISLSQFDKDAYLSISESINKHLIISDWGAIVPYENIKDFNTLKYIPVKHRSSEYTSLKHDINEAMSFYRYLSIKESNWLKINFTTIKGNHIRIVYKLPEDYLNSSPIAYTEFDCFNKYPYYQNHSNTMSSFKDSSWNAMENSLIDFVSRTIVWANQVEFESMFNKWLGSRCSLTQDLG